MRAKTASATTTRNRKLECQACGYVVRTSRANMRRGFPTCVCGAGRLLPWELSDVLDFLEGAELEAHPVYRAYCQAMDSIAHGQAPHVAKYGTLREMTDPSLIAEARVYMAQRDSARRSRLSAISRPSEDLPF